LGLLFLLGGFGRGLWLKKLTGECARAGWEWGVTDAWFSGCFVVLLLFWGCSGSFSRRVPIDALVAAILLPSDNPPPSDWGRFTCEAQLGGASDTPPALVFYATGSGANAVHNLSSVAQQVTALRARFPGVVFTSEPNDNRVRLRSLADCEVMVQHFRDFWGEYHDGTCNSVGDSGVNGAAYFTTRRCIDVLPRLNDLVLSGECPAADPACVHRGLICRKSARDVRPPATARDIINFNPFAPHRPNKSRCTDTRLTPADPGADLGPDPGPDFGSDPGPDPGPDLVSNNVSHTVRRLPRRTTSRGWPVYRPGKHGCV